MKRNKKKRTKLTTSKKALWFILINALVVEVYSMVVMWHFGDLSALYSLIGAIIGEGVAVASYYAKATKENTRGGITYDKAMNTNDTEGQG